MENDAFGGRLFCGILLIAGLLSADTGDSASIKYRTVGMGSMESGQVVRGEPGGSNMTLKRIWCQRSYAQLGFEASIGEHTRLFVVGESMTHYAYAQTKDALDNNKPKFLFYPYHVEGSYSFGTAEKPYLTLGFGTFPFKYNPDVRNLGEYLYRTGTYPPTMSNQFDFPLVRLTGFRASSTPIENLNVIAMLTMESEVIPLKDWGVSFLGDYTFLKTLTIGGGVFLSHWFPVNEDLTSPHVPDNISEIDTLTNDTVYYSFSGIKLMGRLTFDPKPFIPLSIFGPNDLRIYSEVAVLGIKNYEGSFNNRPYYKELKRRIPILLGFNVPCFKVLDVFSVELEWYRWNYPNSFTQQEFAGYPLPIPDNVQDYDYIQNYLKWSFYAKKQMARHFYIIGQVAYDHMRLESNVHQQTSAYYGDAMHKHGDWAWMTKLQFNL